MKNFILTVLCVFAASSAMAFEFPENPFQGEKGDTGEQGIQGIQGEQGVAGVDGIDGTDGIGIAGVDGIDGTTNTVYTNGNNEDNERAIASLSAMAMIPALNNHGGDSGIGAGVGSYGSQQAIAVAFIQQASDNLTFKAGASRGVGDGTSGSDLVLGAGATISW